MKIIALVGPKGAGKDTAYEVLKEENKVHGKISFANPLKEMCAEVFGIAPRLMIDADLKELPFKEPVKLTSKSLRDVKHLCVEYVSSFQENGDHLYFPNKASISGLENRVVQTPRELLQVIGTDFIRNRIYQDWHIKAALRPEALDKLTQSGIYCVTDTRFLNEYEILKEKFEDDFTAIYIERPIAEKTLESATHESELESQKIRALLGEDFIIKNDGSKKELSDKLITIVNSLGISKKVKPPKSRFVFKKK